MININELLVFDDNLIMNKLRPLDRHFTLAQNQIYQHRSFRINPIYTRNGDAYWMVSFYADDNDKYTIFSFRLVLKKSVPVNAERTLEWVKEVFNSIGIKIHDSSTENYYSLYLASYPVMNERQLDRIINLIKYMYKNMKNISMKKTATGRKKV